MKKPPARQTTTRKKHVKHKKNQPQFLKVYWPYIPLFILVFFGLTLGYNWQTSSAPKLKISGVLSYATEMSSSGLLSATNAQRAQHGGFAALTLNSKLSNAAQAKANDMVARNYWSHNTPDGKEPWTFVDAAGYAYQKAGENLAYGFDSPNDTIVGWMNSPSHRSNLLDGAYKEVGFGFANSSSFVGSGEETIVVAMYANPSSVATPAPAPAPAAPTAQAKPSATKTPSSQTTPTPVAQATNQDTVVPSSQVIAAENQTEQAIIADSPQPITSDAPVPASQPTKRITKLQLMTSGAAPWSAALLSGLLVLVVGLWILKHAFVVKKVFVNGEKYILHHPIFDVAVLMFVAAAILLSQSSGIVK